MKNNINQLSVREIQAQDIPLLADYWTIYDPEFMLGMGVNLDKLPSREGVTQMLKGQLTAPIDKKMSYALIWEIDKKAIGHSNINKIQFGEEAYMHLHLWKSDSRQKGRGVELVKLSLPFFFEKLKLKRLLCEPYALNPAPNKTLERVGFQFEKKYTTVPGALNFEQEVNRWSLSREQYLELV